MTLTIGWWILPTLISVGTFAWAFLTPEEPSGGFIPDLMPFFRMIAALIVSLIAWLIYFIVF